MTIGLKGASFAGSVQVDDVLMLALRRLSVHSSCWSRRKNGTLPYWLTIVSKSCPCSF